MLGPPLQVIDSFIISYNVGDVLLIVTVLGGIGLLLRRSNKLFGLHLLTFGLLLMILPGNMLEPAARSFLGSVPGYKFVGLALVVVAPVIFAVGRR